MSVGAAEALAFESSSRTLVCRQLYDFVVTVQQPWELHHVKVLDARDLALQQWIADGRLTLQKIASSGNAADLLTKHVSQKVLQSLVPKLGLQQ